MRLFLTPIERAITLMIVLTGWIMFQCFNGLAYLCRNFVANVSAILAERRSRKAD